MAIAPQYHRYRNKCQNPRCGIIFGSWNKKQRTCGRSCGAQMRRKSTGPNSPREAGMRGGLQAAKNRDAKRWQQIQQAWPEMPDKAKAIMRSFLNLRYLAGRKSGERSGFATGYSHAIGEKRQGSWQVGTRRLKAPVAPAA